MTATHTPGPWASDSTATGATVYQEMAGTIATIPADLLAYRANARLIAAAPDLLDALRGVMNWWAETSTPNGVDDEMPPKLFDAAWLAIARATGKA